jgi:hypothetical protein
MGRASGPIPRSAALWQNSRVRGQSGCWRCRDDGRAVTLADSPAGEADCESALLEDGSQQGDVWGADWNPASWQVTYESLINIRPRQNNPSMEILDPAIQARVAQVTQQLLGGV